MAEYPASRWGGYSSDWGQSQPQSKKGTNNKKSTNKKHRKGKGGWNRHARQPQGTQFLSARDFLPLDDAADVSVTDTDADDPIDTPATTNTDAQRENASATSSQTVRAVDSGADPRVSALEARIGELMISQNALNWYLEDKLYKLDKLDKLDQLDQLQHLQHLPEKLQVRLEKLSELNDLVGKLGDMDGKLDDIIGKFGDITGKAKPRKQEAVVIKVPSNCSRVVVEFAPKGE